MFNPSEYSIDTSSTYEWKPIPKEAQPYGQFVSGSNSTLTLDLFFDTYEEQKDVREHTLRIANLLDIDKELGTPPVCRFVWGSLSFKAVVERVTQKYTLFLSDGRPARATLNVVFKEHVDDQLKHSPSKFAHETKQRMATDGDQLWQISEQEYGDASQWRQIAHANNLDNPLRLTSGARLRVPRRGRW